MPTCEHVAYDTRLAPAASAYGKSISLIDWATSTPPSVRLTSLRPSTTVCTSEPEVMQRHIQTMPEMVLKLEPHYVHALGAGVVLCGSGVKGFQSLGCAWSAVVRLIQVRYREQTEEKRAGRRRQRRQGHWGHRAAWDGARPTGGAAGSRIPRNKNNDVYGRVSHERWKKAD